MTGCKLMMRGIAALAFGIAILGAMSCGGGGGAKYHIGFLMTLDHPYWQNMRLGSVDEGKKLGAEVTVLNAKEDPVLQMEQINEMIAKKVDAVCLVPMKKESLVRGVKLLNAAKIPVIVVNREIGEDCDYVCYVGTDTYGGGKVSADILAKALGGKGEIVEFHQHIGTGPELARSKALEDTLKENPGIKRMARIPHEGKRDVVKREMQTLLQKFPNLAGVYAHGDDFAIAAAQECAAQGRKEVKCVGQGGSEEALQAIRDGLLTGVSFQQPEEEGREGVRLAIRYLKGEKLEKRYPIDSPAVTKENVGKYKGQY
ncbi:MAG: sugar ABC transporter substrate-binding protein [Candidatus Sumerlaeota bacterium]|nr:sugar ABC transporter substrate-binding protein [Candidatus Sumerlaeota bacterium]